MNLAGMPASERAKIVERSRPLLLALAKQSGIVAAGLADDAALEVLADVVQWVVRPPDERPVILVPDERFASKGLTDAGAVRVAVIRSAFTLCVRTIEEACKPGRYLALCVTAMEQACMWAIKSVSHEPKVGS